MQLSVFWLVSNNKQDILETAAVKIKYSSFVLMPHLYLALSMQLFVIASWVNKREVMVYIYF
jgi:hypothetical protein